MSIITMNTSPLVLKTVFVRDSDKLRLIFAVVYLMAGLFLLSGRLSLLA